jgi:serine/threonine protein kinase
MPEPIALFFSETYMACGLLEASASKAQLLEADGHRLLPLFFEIRNGQLIHFTDRKALAASPQRPTYGGLSSLTESHEVYELFGVSYPLSHLLLEPLSRLKRSYWATQQYTETAAAVPCWIMLPTRTSSKTREQLEMVLEKAGFQLLGVQTHDEAISNLLQINDIALYSLGNDELCMLSGDDQRSELLFTFHDEHVREDLARLAVKKALEQSFTNIGEHERQTEYQRHLNNAALWQEKLRRESLIDIHLNFSDGYTGTAAVSRTEYDHLVLPAPQIVGKVRAKGLKDTSRIWLLGQPLNNLVLIELLGQEIARDRIVSFFEDERVLVELLTTTLEQARQHTKARIKNMLHEQIRQWLQTQGGKLLPEQQKALIQEAQANYLTEAEMLQLLADEQAKTFVVRTMGVEAEVMLEEINHPHLGRSVRKMLKQGLQNNQAAKQSFYKEAVLIEKLSHPNLPKVLELSQADTVLPFYIAEFAEGTSLKDQTPLKDLKEVERICLVLLEVLDYLHRNGFWYKTLKTKNIYLKGSQLKLVVSGVEHTDQQQQKKYQNIRDFGLILKEMLTGRTDHLTKIDDKKWADIVQRTSAGSSAANFKDFPDIIEAIRRSHTPQDEAPKPTPPPKPVPYKTIAIGVILALLALGAFIARERIEELLCRVGLTDCAQTDISTQKLVGRYNGKLKAGKRSLDVWLTIQSVDESDNSFQYTLELDSMRAGTRMYRESRQKGQLQTDAHLLHLSAESPLGDLEYLELPSGKVLLKSKKYIGFELE